jgi:hypothetical protein
VTPIGIPLAAVALIGLGLTATAQAQQDTMSFFVTSVGEGKGADLGGLAGADAHCQALAQAAGSTKTNWHAYLSTTEPGGAAGVNARDRIGKGPWQNAKGVVVAKSLEDLHSDSSNINKQTALTEKGEIVSGRGSDSLEKGVPSRSTRSGPSILARSISERCGMAFCLALESRDLAAQPAILLDRPERPLIRWWSRSRE